MVYSDDDKKVLNEKPDIERQIQILEEEKKSNDRAKKFRIVTGSMLLLIVLVFIISYSTVYIYREYGTGKISTNPCDNVNIDLDGDGIPDINITDSNECIPKYNIDYYNNRSNLFNQDIYGDRTYLFNSTNQMDPTGTYCLLNCDDDEDGWPDYNIDLNGDGVADINIVLNPQSSNHTCDINCDINDDMVADTNIDLNNDNIADVNITDGDYTKPIYNIDYKNNHVPTFNIKNGNNITNPVTSVKENPSCTKNCDIDEDGWPEYNIVINDTIINEKISTDNNDTVYYNTGKYLDYKCYFDNSSNTCNSLYKGSKNTYINIDVDGDGVPDVNLSSDGGKTIDNQINKTSGGKVLNYDKDNDGFPDYNIDIDNDGIADINIVDDNYNCTKNCDYDLDGTYEYNFTVYGKLVITEDNLNIDYNYDGICDINCDLDGDNIPDINVDIDGDNKPDINIDYDHDKVADYNIDNNKDGIIDENIDAYGVGTCNFNCNGQNTVNSGDTCIRNCDINNDGKPETNVDINNDGICDFNCNGIINDSDYNYYLDSEYENVSQIIEFNDTENSDMYVINPLDIHGNDIEPGWNGKYVLYLKNTSKYAVAYKIMWTNVTNDFTTTNNLSYYVSRSNTNYMSNLKAPYQNITLSEEEILRKGTTMTYVLDMSFVETGVNQSEDAGKTFKGSFIIEVLS